MEKQLFTSMMEKLASLIADSKVCAQVLENADSVGSMPIEDYNKICKRARQIQADEDRIFKAELYHIIGMGGLSATQTLQFTKAIRELGEYRSAVKRVATAQLAQFNGAPEVPSEFTASCLLGGLVLTSGGVKHE